MTLTRFCRLTLRNSWRLLPLTGLAWLTACGQGPAASVQAQCQQWLGDLQQQRRVLREAAQSGSATVDNFLQPFNQWLIHWDNGNQQMAATAALAKGIDSQNAAAECQTALAAPHRQLFASTELARGLNQVNVNDEPVSTQHFVNKLRQAFLRHGANLQPGARDRVLNLHQHAAAPDAIDLPAWYALQQQLAGELGFVDPLLLSRSQQMLPLNSMVRDYLAHVESNLGAAVIQPEALDFSFDWPAVKQGLSSLTQALFAVELIPTEIPSPFAVELNRPMDSFQVFENGQLVGELFIAIAWHPGQQGVDHLEYYPLQRGIAGGQKPRFVIAGDLYPASDGRILNHGQLVAVLHQFGHFLHHQLASNQSWLLNAGLGSEADFTEAPAKLLEYWAWAPRGLRFFQRQSLSETQKQRLTDLHQQSRQWQRRALFEYANALEQWFISANEKSNHAQPAITLAGNFSHDHCQQHPAIAYRCLAAMDIADTLVQDFQRFGFDDRQTANKLRREVLAPGGSRPGLDRVGAYLDRSYWLYE